MTPKESAVAIFNGLSVNVRESLKDLIKDELIKEMKKSLEKTSQPRKQLNPYAIIQSSSKNINKSQIIRNIDEEFGKGKLSAKEIRQIVQDRYNIILHDSHVYRVRSHGTVKKIFKKDIIQTVDSNFKEKNKKLLSALEMVSYIKENYGIDVSAVFVYITRSKYNK